MERRREINEVETVRYILMNDKAVRENISQMLRKRCLARAGGATSNGDYGIRLVIMRKWTTYPMPTRITREFVDRTCSGVGSITSWRLAVGSVSGVIVGLVHKENGYGQGQKG